MKQPLHENCSFLSQKRDDKKYLGNTRLKPSFQNLDDEIKHLNQLQSTDSNAISKKIVKVIDKERERFAQDLHDGVGQELYTLRLFCDALEFLQNNPEQFSKTLKQVKVMLEETMTNVKLIARNTLNKKCTGGDLTQCVLPFIEQINSIKPGHISWDCEGFKILFLEESELVQVYRIIQEFVTNSLKYSNADRIEIRFKRRGQDSLEVILKDNGKGFDIKQNRISSGVSSIYYRLNLLEATFAFTSSKEEGTQLTFIINGKCNFTFTS